MEGRAIVVSHSHWDRAWYLPFEQFRHRLVRLIDGLIDLLDARPDFPSFMLDGQVVLLDDYLEIRPERRADLERLVRAGRLRIGPWYTAPDLFLPSGEALVRNLQRGLRLSATFGGGERIGYAPDPFGHPAQMPQIMRGFGIDLYLFMRGMPETWIDTGALFEWQSPDGGSIPALYLAEGYFGAGALGQPGVFGRFDGHMPDVDAAKRQLTTAVARMAELQTTPVFLLLNGFDHMPVQMEIPELVRTIDAEVPGLSVEHGSLADFREAILNDTSDLPVRRGDLLGQLHHPILSSVWSARMYIKQQNHAAEDALLRFAEPIAAGLSGVAPSPGPFLDHAWKLLLLNHPHDDICGCSVDGVHDDDEVRFRQVCEIADSVIVEHLEGLLTDERPDAWRADENHALVVVFNPHPFPLRKTVDARIAFPIPGGEHGEPRPRSTIRAVYPDDTEIPLRVTGFVPRAMRGAYLEQTWAEHYDVSFDLSLPPLGYTIVRFTRDGNDEPSHPPLIELGLEGRVLEVIDDQVQLRQGAYAIAPLLAFEFERDSGDTYSFSPVAGDAVRRSRLVSHRTTDARTLDARYEIDVPAALGTDDLTTLAIDVRFQIEASGGVSARIRYENTARDGRLRAIIATGIVAERSFADSQFAIAEHEVVGFQTPETQPDRHAAYPGELPYPTHHQRSFCYVGDGHDAVWVANRGLSEYELRPDASGGTIAVTLHRSVGHLSIVGGRLRRCGAGPNLETPGAQCLRRFDTTLTIGFAPDDIRAITAQALPAAHPPMVREMPYLPYRGGVPAGLRRDSWLAVEDVAIRLASFRKTNDGVHVVRLFNPTPDARSSRIRIDSRWTRIRCASLEERWDDGIDVEIEDDHLTINFRPGEIMTLLLRA